MLSFLFINKLKLQDFEFNIVGGIILMEFISILWYNVCYLVEIESFFVIFIKNLKNEV